MSHDRLGSCNDPDCNLVHPDDVLARLSQTDRPWLELVREAVPFEKEAIKLWLLEVDFIAAIADMGALHALPVLNVEHMVAIISVFLATCERINNGRLTPLPIPLPECTCPNGEHNDPPGRQPEQERQPIPDLFLSALHDLNVDGI